MLSAKQLAVALKSISTQEYSRNVFRAVELGALLMPKHMQPLYDLGPRATGQRYTPVGGPRALYAAEHPATAYFEGTGMFTAVAALAHQNAPATVTFNLSVHLQSLLDVTDPSVQSRLGTTEVELTRCWKWQMAMGQVVPTHV